MDVAELLTPVATEIAQVEKKLHSLAEASSGGNGVPSPSWMLGLIDNAVGDGGKRIRPALTLLAGNFHQYRLDLLIPMAAAVELLHTATLVHDDTIDNSSLRRGKSTINAIWSDDIAVLAGDYLFANSADMVATTGNVYVMRLFARTLMTICQGELGQVFAAYNANVGRDKYFERIERKTAALFAMATESGAVLSGAPESAVQCLKRYGHKLGIAFQIIDDVLDFNANETEMGKPVASDLIQGTMTLPAILLAERYPKDNPVSVYFADDSRDEALLDRAIEMIRNSDIIEESLGVAAKIATEARNDMDGLPSGPARRSLEDLTQYILERRK